MIWDGILLAKARIGTRLLTEETDPTRTEPILWQWVPFGDDNAIRQLPSLLRWTVIGLAALAMAVYILDATLDPFCTGSICSRGYFGGAAGLIAGLLCLAFPWIGTKWRVLLTGRFSLTDNHFVRTKWNELVSFPLRDGRIVIRYGCAWFEPLSGPRKRLTPRMSRAEATRLFAAVAEVRAIQRNREHA